jgi:hypothetical protein
VKCNKITIQESELRIKRREKRRIDSMFVDSIGALILNHKWYVHVARLAFFSPTPLLPLEVEHSSDSILVQASFDAGAEVRRVLR